MKESARHRRLGTLAMGAFLTLTTVNGAEASVQNQQKAIKSAPTQTPTISSQTSVLYDSKLEEAKNTYYELGQHCPTDSKKPVFIFEEGVASTYRNSTLTVNAYGSSSRISKDIKTGMDKWCVEKTGQKLQNQIMVKPLQPVAQPPSAEPSSDVSIAQKVNITTTEAPTTTAPPKYKEGVIDIVAWSREFLASLYYENPIAGGIPELREFENTGFICNPYIYYPNPSIIGGFARYPGEVMDKGVVCLSPDALSTEWGIAATLSANISHEYNHLMDHQQGFYSPDTERRAYTFERSYILKFADFCAPPNSGYVGCNVRYKDRVIQVKIDRNLILGVLLPYLDNAVASN